MNENQENKKSSFMRVAIAVSAVFFLASIFYFFVQPTLRTVQRTHELLESFEKLDKELDRSSIIVGAGDSDPYEAFQKKKMEFRKEGGDLKNLEFWEQKATKIQLESAKLRGYILGECNEMIKIAEDKDWVEQYDIHGNIMNLKSASDITKKDNYDIPTLYFLGPNFNIDNPDQNVRAYQLFRAIVKFRKIVLDELGTYKTSSKQFIFKTPKDNLDLREAYKTCNPQDTLVIGEVYRSLAFPEMVMDNSTGKLVPYPYTLFNKVPVILVYAQLIALTVDIKQAEMIMAEHFLKKIDR
jgi:hypothetical protein